MYARQEEQWRGVSADSLESSAIAWWDSGGDGMKG